MLCHGTADEAVESFTQGKLKDKKGENIKKRFMKRLKDKFYAADEVVKSFTQRKWERGVRSTSWIITTQ